MSDKINNQQYRDVLNIASAILDAGVVDVSMEDTVIAFFTGIYTDERKLYHHLSDIYQMSFDGFKNINPAFNPMVETDITLPDGKVIDKDLICESLSYLQSGDVPTCSMGM